MVPARGGIRGGRRTGRLLPDECALGRGRQGQAGRSLAVCRGRPHPHRLRQPPVVRAAGLRQRAGRRRPPLRRRGSTTTSSAIRDGCTPALGWPQITQNQYHVTPEPRVSRHGGGGLPRINARPPETTTDYRALHPRRSVPVISHEIGQWCVYPNLAEIRWAHRPPERRKTEIFRDTLTANHLADQAQRFLLASGKLQTLCYKEEIEAILRTPGSGGFQLLDLHDFPGQERRGWHVLDPFWEEKVTPAEYHRSAVRPCPSPGLPKRVYTVGENAPRPN
ncbi:MAG: hypothetical protein U0736_16490 [Gemmataceae bacterium]